MPDKLKKPTDSSALTSSTGDLVKYLGREKDAKRIALGALDSGTDPLLASILGEAAAVAQEGGIEAMEALGQEEFVESDALPAKFQEPWNCDVDAQAEMSKLGFELGTPFEDDPLFVPAILPEGWTKSGSECAMTSNILDERGRKRAWVFYKAAFYDRKAHWGFSLRIHLLQDWELHRNTEGKEVRYTVAATTGGPDTPRHQLFEAIEEAPGSDKAYSTQANDASDRAKATCYAWLDENYPDHNNPFAYWDVEL